MALEAHLNKNSELILCVNLINAFSSFNQIFLHLTEDFAPLKSGDSKHKVPKWFDIRLKNLREKKPCL